MNLTSTVKLNNGVEMPLLGLGTFRAENGEQTYSAVLGALGAGYRHIDTAAVYGNEESVGRAIRDSGVPRGELFVTTKLWNADMRADRQRAALEESLGRLGLDYVDLYLIHWPVKDKYVSSWLQLEKFYSEKLCRAIGVSNFNIHHLEDIFREGSVMPAVNQCECHPWLTQAELADYCAAHGIVFEPWSPLAAGQLLSDETLAAIASAHGKSISQVILRWGLQRGFVNIPKSVRLDRIMQNSEIFDFELPDTEMSRISAMNCGRRVGSDPETFTF